MSKNNITTVKEAIKKFENMIAYMKANYELDQEFRIEVDDNCGGSWEAALIDIQVREGNGKTIWMNVGC